LPFLGNWLPLLGRDLLGLLICLLLHGGCWSLEAAPERLVAVGGEPNATDGKQEYGKCEYQPRNSDRDVINGKAEVIDAMDDCGDDEGEQPVEIRLALIAQGFVAMRQAIVVTQEDATDAVQRHGENCPCKRDANVRETYYVQDVFKCGKTKTRHDAIDDAVEGVVELGPLADGTHR